MTGFYLTLLAVLLAGLGARDQSTIAALAARQGARPGVLLTGIAVGIVTAAFAAWAASLVVPVLAPRARILLAVIALALAGLEALLAAPGPRPREPTNSLGALAFVLLAQQASDAARFLVFAMAVATNAPVAAGLAGAVGGGVLLATGWAAPEAVGHSRIRQLRRALGIILLLVAGFVALRAFARI